MAVSSSGVFGALEIDGTTNTVDTWYVLETVDSGYWATVNIRAVNRAATAAAVRLAIEVNGVTATPDDAEHIEYDTPLEPAANQGNILENTAIVLYQGDSLLVRSDTADVNFIAWGVVSAI